MAAVKMKLIAQRFMLQIQDIYQVDGTGNVLPGNLVRSIDDLNNYLGQAMNKFFTDNMKSSAGRQDFINKFPEFFAQTALQTIPAAHTTLDISALANNKDIYDVMDSPTSVAGVVLEAWNPVHLNDALALRDPFYVGTATTPGMMLLSPILYLFPVSFVQSGTFAFKLNYIKLPVSPTTGKYYDVNSTTEDCPFSIDHCINVADIATALYAVDDSKEDPGD
jgi:hypothetical protein